MFYSKKVSEKTYDFVLMIDAHSIFDECSDDFEVSLSGRPLESRVTSLEKNRKKDLI